MKMKTQHKRLVEIGFPDWVQALLPEERKILADVGRIRLRRSNPIAARVEMSDDVAIANLLFRVSDKAAVFMLMDAFDFKRTLWEGASCYGTGITTSTSGYSSVKTRNQIGTVKQDDPA